MTFVAADPYPWPFDGALTPQNTTLIVIDMQTDFCGKGGYIDLLGYDISATRAPIEPISRVMTRMRALGYHVMHTREGHRPDLADLPANKRWRSRRVQGGGAPQTGIGDPGPCGRVLVRGEPGWDIIPELKPLEGEPIIDKPGKGSFHATDLHQILLDHGIKTLIVCGVTLEVCVQNTVLEANDRGYECVVLSDCEASYSSGMAA